MEIKVIKSEEDYGRAIDRLSELMTLNPDPSTAEANELELLALVISKYESTISTQPIPNPVEAILFRLDQAGLTRKDLVPYLGSESRVSEVLSRKRPLSISMIRKLNVGLGIPLASLIVDPDDEETSTVPDAPQILRSPADRSDCERSQDVNQFQVGTVVRLNSGGPPMTVTIPRNAERKVTCHWFDGSTVRRGAFPQDALEPVEDQNPRLEAL